MRNVLLVLAAILLFAPHATNAAPPKGTGRAPASAPATREKAKLVFVAMTGLEDLMTLSSSLRHATVAAKSPQYSEVVWMSYGRSIVALDPTVKAVPASIHELAREAKKAGVRLVACEEALKKFDIDPKRLAFPAETVPNAIDELGRLIAEGFAVIRY